MTIPPAAASSDIVHLERLELAYAPRPWRFALERRTEIDHHFATLRQTTPELWNGRMLLLAEHVIERAVFRGSFLETDFASFVAWRDWGFPDTDVLNCFAMGALRASDGAYLLGVMGPQTVNAGKIYFPAGVPDRDDIVGDRVDLARNVRREMAEETGLGPDDYRAGDHWVCVRTGPRLAMMKPLDSPEPAERLRERILAHLARDPQPELAGIRIVRGPADLDAMMPPFVIAFLNEMWSRT
jgi:8-oxo-dGTP pyrophosphatase MutT (NUDIX family)